MYVCMGGILGFLFDNAVAVSITGFLAWLIDNLNKCRCGKKVLSTATKIDEHIGIDMNISLGSVTSCDSLTTPQKYKCDSKKIEII